MHIIGGTYRGRTIAMPRGARIRPTSNKVREALFNILRAGIRKGAVLDLFAGSGSVGLEAISRGATSSVFVDNNTKCINIVRNNIEKLGVEADAKVTQLNALQAVKKLSGKSEFDLIFIDPPYFKGWIKKVLINLDQYDILKKLGVIVCEHHKKEEVPEMVGRLVRFRQNKYGDTILSFYKIDAGFKPGESLANEKKSSISRDV